MSGRRAGGGPEIQTRDQADEEKNKNAAKTKSWEEI